mmetsp:Transcript_11664/g.29611  ORF Transcript_11664/g.29611 Transcript_11664/m.29611 type:complete len:202 (+) Transcript_11664:1490-2095(+)
MEEGIFGSHLHISFKIFVHSSRGRRACMVLCMIDRVGCERLARSRRGGRLASSALGGPVLLHVAIQREQLGVRAHPGLEPIGAHLVVQLGLNLVLRELGRLLGLCRGAFLAQLLGAVCLALCERSALHLGLGALSLGLLLGVHFHLGRLLGHGLGRGLGLCLDRGLGCLRRFALGSRSAGRLVLGLLELLLPAGRRATLTL